MTDTTDILTSIRELAEDGIKLVQDPGYPHNDDDPFMEVRTAFEAILHNLNQMEATMDTDTTDDAQWWWVAHSSQPGRNAPWAVSKSFADNDDQRVKAELLGGWWKHHARVQLPSSATDHDIYQAAVDAWAEAGFAHAPQEPPGPKRVEVTGYAVVNGDRELKNIHYFPYNSLESAEKDKEYEDDHNRHPSGYRIVMVEAVVSEGE